MSYLQSLLVISPASTIAVPDKSGDVIDAAALNTFDIVWLAKKAMEIDDLEQAVKYVHAHAIGAEAVPVVATASEK